MSRASGRFLIEMTMAATPNMDKKNESRDGKQREVTVASLYYPFYTS